MDLFDTGRCAQNLLSSFSFKPVGAELPNNVTITNQLIEEEVGAKGLASALSLLVHLSPATGEPVALHSNNRLTQMKSILATSTISAVNSDAKQETLNFFISAVEPREEINFEKNQIADFKDGLMQSWMELNYREKGNPSKIHAKL